MGRAETQSHQSSDTYGESESDGMSASDTEGTSGSDSWSHGSSMTWSPMLMPILGKEALPPQFRTMQEQLFRFTQLLAFQPKRHCWAKIVGISNPLALTIPILRPPLTGRKWTERWISAVCARTTFILSAAEATLRLKAREGEVARLFDQPSAAAEPTTARRLLKNGREA